MAGILEHAGKRYEALAIHRMVLRQDPDHWLAVKRSVDLKLTLCDWNDYDDFVKGVLEPIESAVENSQPLNLCVQDLQNLPITWPALASAAKRSADMAEDQVRVDRKKANFTFDQRLNSWRSGNQRKLRVGWALPYTFHHSFPMLLKTVIERMDRQNFEVVGYSIRPGDTYFDRQYRGTFDSFRDIPAASPEISAKMIYDDEIDVLIDVTGHTSINCQAVMAMRPAPVQAHMMGYANTTGSEYIDFLVTDPVWMQPKYRELCTETMVYLPDSFFVGYRPEISEQTFSRAELNLPEGAFVFCSFNQPFKFEPSMFDVWMHMLKRIEGSVLWLGAWDEATRANLTKEALGRDVDPSRLVFAKIENHSTHLSRLSQADLMLDTRFHGGGATTIDALWAGVPILTCHGEIPNSGNGTTLANAMGLPEMAVGSLEEYEELAVDLAKNPARYADLRAAVGRNRLTHPLFDQDRYTRHLEQAVQLMWEQKVNNESGDIVVRSGNFFKAPDARLLSGSTRLQPSGERNEKSEESGT
jgi:predicted O-linked N-acetylglucosamine transferase (SPINDLY family)